MKYHGVVGEVGVVVVEVEGWAGPGTGDEAGVEGGVPLGLGLHAGNEGN